MKKLSTTGDQCLCVSPSTSKSRLARLLIQTIIDECQDPLVGLDYITEFQRHKPGEEPIYTCDLCSSQMDPRQVINHVTGMRHRRRFMKIHYPDVHEKICEVTRQHGRTSGSSLAEVYARAVTLRDGRTKVRLKVELSKQEAGERISDENLMRMHDGSLWEEIGDDGKPLKTVALGPEELARYSQWTEEETDHFIDIEPDHAPAPTRSSDKDLQKTNVYGQGLKRPSSEPLEYKDHSKCMLLQTCDPYASSSETRDRDMYQCGQWSYSNADLQAHYNESTTPERRYNYERSWHSEKTYDQVHCTTELPVRYCNANDAQMWTSSTKRYDTSRSSCYPSTSGVRPAQFVLYPVGAYDEQTLSDRTNYGAQTSSLSAYHGSDMNQSRTNPTDHSPCYQHPQPTKLAYYYQDKLVATYDHPVTQTTDTTYRSSAPSQSKPRNPHRNGREMPVYMSGRPPQPLRTENRERRKDTNPRICSVSGAQSSNVGSRQTSMMNNVAKHLQEATGSGSRAQAEQLLLKLTGCTVTSQKEAELAFHVANGLTKALAHYTIRTFSGDVKQSNKSDSGSSTVRRVKSNDYFDRYSFSQQH